MHFLTMRRASVTPLRLRRTHLFAGLGLALAAATAVAQTVDDGQGSSAASLGLPSDLTIFGKTDPAIRKPTAIVNGTIVTDTDVDQRLALVLSANGGGDKVEGEERDRLRLQVLRNLIDETLQIQEARANDIAIQKDDVQQTYNRVATNFRQKGNFAEYLKSIGSSEASIRRQIEGEMAWRRLLGRKVEPFVNVGQEEVQAVIKRLNDAKGTDEYHVGEIFLSSTPERNEQTLANANRIVEQVRKGASFVAYARQFSEASTAAVGGDLGWVRPGQLPEPMSVALTQMQTGQVSAPIAIPGGYTIVALVDKRQVLTTDPRDAVLSLKQISLSFPVGMTQAQATPRVEAFAKGIKTIGGCGKAEDAARMLGAEIVANDAVKIRDLPPQLQPVMLQLSVGEATPPFGSLTEGVRTLVLCGRDDPQSASGPDYDQIYAQMEEERVNRRAQRYLRDLRRDAVIEYR